MEGLFSTNISINGKNAVYRVVFENERYTFVPEAEDNELKTFSIKRENDEWHETELLDSNLRIQAVDALEKYLLSQH